MIDGMSVILHCETSGAPRPAITWQKGPLQRTPPPRRSFLAEQIKPDGISFAGI